MMVLKIVIVGLSALLALGIIWYVVADPMGGPLLKKVKSVDLARFMGDWYVIASIPVFVEKYATNAVERYTMNDDGTIAITYTFNESQPGGEKKEFTAKAWVVDTASNAEWKVQFFWPIRFPFYVMELADDYSYVVVGVPNRSYIWIMARTPSLSEATYDSLLTRIDAEGFNTGDIKLVPQSWPEGRPGD